MHLIGSVPLADAETVFRTVSAALGPHLSRLPDGETGERRRWIYFQRLMLEKHPAMEVDPTVPLFALRQWDGKLLRETPLLRFRAGIDPDSVTFETGYAPAARASYETFRALKAAGVIRGACGSRSACRRRWRAPTCTSARRRASRTSARTSAPC